MQNVRSAGTEPFATGLLRVSDGNDLYWEAAGNPQGKPALYLHGGPGSGITNEYRHYFDPNQFFIVSFEQFPVSLFLVSPGRETLPITLFNYLKFDLDGTIGAASAVSILLAVLVVIGLDRTVGLRSTAKL